MFWDDFLLQESEQEYMKKLGNFLNTSYQERIVYPPKKYLFRSLELTSFEKTKVIILGQDPYHGADQANGLAFAVNPGQAKPPSLRNIFTEVKSDYGFEPKDTSLIGWAQQGVLLLNTSLSVESGKPNSHQAKGWEILTDKIIYKLAKDQRCPKVFVLWGASAQAKHKLIFDNDTSQEHLILTCPHPSPLSAHRGFFGCQHFTKTNTFLSDNNLPPIRWEESGE